MDREREIIRIMRIKTYSLVFITLCFAIHSIAQVIQTDSLTYPVSVKKDKQDSLHKQKGYFNNSQIGIGVRLGLPVLSISTVNGYQFSRHVSLGLGVGYSHTYLPLWNSWELIGAKMTKSDYHVNVDHLDLFIENRLFLGNNKSAFLLFDLGYSFFLSPNTHELTAREKSEYWSDFPYVWGDSLEKITYTGRIFLAPGAGMRIFIHKNLSLNVSVQLYVSGYLITQHYQSESAYDPPYATNKLKINLYPLLSIGIGF